LTADPIKIFQRLYAEASRVSDEPDAMVLSTVDEDGQPSGRFVLLKEADDRGFVFYTNLESRKAQALRVNPRASLCFYWPVLGKQIRIEGQIESVTEAQADVYFASRPRDSQIGAWASQQSMPLASRQELDTRVADVKTRFGDGPISRPPFWSGFRVVPHSIEFWTREAARLHVRERYQRADGVWTRTLLFP
jgi:pyridoxamine 5'-phosphate oxidase